MLCGHWQPWWKAETLSCRGSRLWLEGSTNKTFAQLKKGHAGSPFYRTFAVDDPTRAPNHSQTWRGVHQCKPTFSARLSTLGTLSPPVMTALACRWNCWFHLTEKWHAIKIITHFIVFRRRVAAIFWPIWEMLSVSKINRGAALPFVPCAKFFLQNSVFVVEIQKWKSTY